MDQYNTENQTIQDSETGIKRTSLNIPEDLWEDFRVAAIRRKMKATEAIKLAIRQWIDADAA